VAWSANRDRFFQEVPFDKCASLGVAGNSRIGLGNVGASSSLNAGVRCLRV